MQVARVFGALKMITIDRIDAPNSEIKQRRKADLSRFELHPAAELALNERFGEGAEERGGKERLPAAQNPTWIGRAWRLLTSSMQNRKDGGNR
ncbi:MAG: hypothetical protein ANABAC_2861 [Anaerolineae bacterium]|nr:MAG: hypothetical protein ANABAC_2861 [Anaerolineae bacterium]